jgi:hypothetical protein
VAACVLWVGSALVGRSSRAAGERVLADRDLPQERAYRGNRRPAGVEADRPPPCPLPGSQRLNAIPAWTARLRSVRQDAVLELQALGWSRAQIGDALGIHRSRVQQIAEGRHSGGEGSRTSAAEQ